MSKIETGGPAFPRPFHETVDGNFSIAQTGMSLRDYFAAKALQGMASIALDDGDMIMGWRDMSEAAYKAADAMLAARGGDRG